MYVVLTHKLCHKLNIPKYTISKFNIHTLHHLHVYTYQFIKLLMDRRLFHFIYGTFTGYL